MTQAIVSTDPNVATLQESVRHNEKNIDRLDRDLKDFRSETLKQFEKVDQRFDKVDDRFNQLHSWQQRTLDDSGGGKDGTISSHNVTRPIDPLNFRLRHTLHLPGLGLGIGKPHSQLDLPAERP